MTAWETMSKPELIRELATAARQLEQIRTKARQSGLKLELLEKVHSSMRGSSNGA